MIAMLMEGGTASTSNLPAARVKLGSRAGTPPKSVELRQMLRQQFSCWNQFETGMVQEMIQGSAIACCWLSRHSSFRHDQPQALAVPQARLKLCPQLRSCMLPLSRQLAAGCSRHRCFVGRQLLLRCPRLDA